MWSVYSYDILTFLLLALLPSFWKLSRSANHTGI